MTPSPASPDRDWIARPAPAAAPAAPWPTPDGVGTGWTPLRQAWRPAPEPDFNPGWARACWSAQALRIDALFVGRNQRNRARGLNERTWELGDIFEFFVRAEGAPRYLEVHVTPENHRLQLRWPDGGLADFRAGRAGLEAFTVTDPAWVASEVRREPDHWGVRLEVPWRCLGLPAAAAPRPVLHACVCRYDCGRGGEVLSSTAPLREPNYHRLEDWPRLRLGD